ncbi:sigma 54-interacting transcriptional regulator [uncultured Pseudodesulfovibrio sp.]|uniref:sigma-54 interaction domain-containing protein n=1 Tax=uncultured Pseudodesulfovibrio sp. TaxID=2035858 RepID=UPI0029C853D7|nr:sigma 54-interacting transcriptional regulator [uncultured Pseudodesulfovibrio sp.]
MSKPTYDELMGRCRDLKDQVDSFKETKAQLLKSEQQLTRLFNNLPGMVYRCSLDANLRPTLDFVSNGVGELFGVPSEFFTDQHTNVMETLAHPDDLHSMRKEQDSAIVNKRSYRLIYRVCLESDQLKWISDQGECIYDEAGTPIALEGIMMDVSAQKLREYELLQENQRLQGSLEDRYKFGPIIGKSQGMLDVFKLIMKAAKRDANVIIFGETGTGKDLVAQTIHEQSGTGGPYVPVNCGAIPENLMESEFFGHKKGAFSGATSDRQGYLAAADGGTLFLDEVGEIGLSLQVKLLRALESKLYTPVGGNEPRSSKFRLIAATNRDLNELVKQGRMRSDFFYRLHVLPIHVPPLRNRREDLSLLINEFMVRYLGNDKQVPQIPAKIRAALDGHHWPGNVRELQNVMERYLTFGEMVFSDLGIQAIDGQSDLDAIVDKASECATLVEALDVIERHMLLKALEKNHWKKGITASDLGLNMRTLQRKLKKYGL